MLTDAQIAILKANVLANTDPVVVNAVATGSTQAIADWYNQEAVPTLWVFKNSVTTDLARDEGLDWEEILTGAPIGALQRWAFDTMMANGDFDPQIESNRDGLNKIFQGQPTTKLKMLTLATRKATYAEVLFAVSATGPGGGNGSAPAQSAIAVFYGNVTREDIQRVFAP